VTGEASYVPELCRIYVLMLLAAAAVGKAAGLSAFEGALENLIGLGARSARAVALLVIGTEAGLALLLLAGGRWAAAGMAGALLLLASFTAFVAVALARGAKVGCNCFGGAARPISGYDVARNLIALGAGALYLARGTGRPGLAPGELALLGLCALILLLVTTSLGEIAELAR